MAVLLASASLLVGAGVSPASAAYPYTRPNAGQFCKKADRGVVTKAGNGRRVRCVAEGLALALALRLDREERPDVRPARVVWSRRRNGRASAPGCKRSVRHRSSTPRAERRRDARDGPLWLLGEYRLRPRALVGVTYRDRHRSPLLQTDYPLAALDLASLRQTIQGIRSDYGRARDALQAASRPRRESQATQQFFQDALTQDSGAASKSPTSTCGPW